MITFTLPTPEMAQATNVAFQHRILDVQSASAALSDDNPSEPLNDYDFDALCAMSFTAPDFVKSNLWLSAAWIWMRLRYQHPVGLFAGIAGLCIFIGAWGRYLLSGLLHW